MANLMRVKSARWAFNCRDWKPTESDWLLVSSSIQEEEKERIGRFVFQRDAKFAMAGRLLSRRFIVDSTGLKWKDVNIVRDAYNKPIFLYATDLQFNISHAGDYVVLSAEMGNLKLGVDVMKLREDRKKNVPEFFRLMTRQFSDEEWRTIKSKPTEAEQMDVFYRYWCLKESYTKALGTGLSHDMKRTSFRLKTLVLNNHCFVEDTEVFVDNEKQNDWLFQEMLLDDCHTVAVAIYKGSSTSYCEKFSFLKYEDLIQNIMEITPPDIEYCKEFMEKEVVS